MLVVFLLALFIHLSVVGYWVYATLREDAP